MAGSDIAGLLRVFGVAVLDSELLLQALSLGWDGFEDAVQAVSAARCRCHYIITRDTESRNSPVQFIVPADFNRLATTG